MEYRWIEDMSDFEKIALEWDEAVLSGGDDNPFLLSDFIITWWRHYKNNLKLCIFVVYDAGRLAGGLPLCRNRSGRMEYVGGINANYTEFLSCGAGRAVWDELFRALAARNDWRLLQLRRYRKDRIARAAVGIAESGTYNDVLFDICGREPAYLVTIPRDFEEYVRRLPIKLRYFMNRSIRRAAKEGEMTFDPIQTCADVDAMAKEFIGISRRSFSKRNKDSAFEAPAYCAFFEELMRRLFQKKYLDAYVLKLNGRVMAIYFGYSIGNNLNFVFTTYDVDMAGLKPGHLLIYKLIELGSRRRNKFFNFFTGYQYYKKEWSDRLEEVVFIELRPDTLPGRIERKVAGAIRSSQAVGKTREAVLASPSLARLGRRVKGFLRNYT